MPLETFDNLESLATVRAKLNLAIEAINTLEEAGAAEWGNISGTLSDQSDLLAVINDLQPLDSDLTAIAALTTTSYGRSLLELANVGALKTSLSLVKGDVGLGNVDNTSDASKPISTATQTALDLKQGLTLDQSTITYAGTVDLDMAVLTGKVRTISLTGNLTFTTSNRANGRQVAIRLICDGTNRTLTFPAGWIFIGNKPANISASKVGVLSLTFFGSADSDCVAAWGVQE